MGNSKEKTEGGRMKDSCLHGLDRFVSWGLQGAEATLLGLSIGILIKSDFFITKREILEKSKERLFQQ